MVGITSLREKSKTQEVGEKSGSGSTPQRPKTECSASRPTWMRFQRFFFGTRTAFQTQFAGDLTAIAQAAGSLQSGRIRLFCSIFMLLE
jgi:hypothetical protein